MARLKAPQNIIEPIPVAANASVPSLPTMATSTTLIKTLLKLLKIIGNERRKTSLEIFLSCGKRMELKAIKLKLGYYISISVFLFCYKLEQMLKGIFFYFD